MNDDWDIEKYYNYFEPDEQWEMKKKFMECYKSDFPEERVVCLAQVLVNVEFLGTRYQSKDLYCCVCFMMNFLKNDWAGTH